MSMVKQKLTEILFLKTFKMEATDLLAREEEFKKLNKQLEKKTESLMKQIEHAMVCFFYHLF